MAAHDLDVVGQNTMTEPAGINACSTDGNTVIYPYSRCLRGSIVRTRVYHFPDIVVPKPCDEAGIIDTAHSGQFIRLVRFKPARPSSSNQQPNPVQFDRRQRARLPECDVICGWDWARGGRRCIIPGTR